MSEIKNYYYYIIIFFLNLNFLHMCIYTVKNNFFFNKKLLKGGARLHRTSQN